MAVRSVFAELGLKKTVQIISKEIQNLYAMDDVPWIIGYSGGKDSTACVQLVWNALAGLSKQERHKDVHIFSTNPWQKGP